MNIEYPLYLAPLEAGYVSVVEPGADDQQTYYLAVFTSEELAASFMRECGIEGEPRPLKNSREFAWLLQSLRAPISDIAFDPVAETGAVDAQWTVSTQELLTEHLRVNYSPWDYPVFAIAQDGGYACIEGQTEEGDGLRAVGLFTNQEKAEEYLKQAAESGELRPLEDMAQVRAFLEEELEDVAAVALNLTVDEGQRKAKYCFSIKTLLERYLVDEQ